MSACAMLMIHHDACTPGRRPQGGRFEVVPAVLAKSPAFCIFGVRLSFKVFESALILFAVC